MLRGPLSKVDRGAAAGLAAIWLVAGIVGLAAGAIHQNVPLLVVSALVEAWGVVWATVAWRGRLLAFSRNRSRRGAPP